MTLTPIAERLVVELSLPAFYWGGKLSGQLSYINSVTVMTHLVKAFVLHVAGRMFESQSHWNVK